MTLAEELVELVSQLNSEDDPDDALYERRYGLELIA